MQPCENQWTVQSVRESPLEEAGQRQRLMLYLATTFILSWGLQAALIARGGLAASGPLGTLALMWIPGGVALALKSSSGTDTLGWTLPRNRWWWIFPYALPVCVGAIAYGTAWMTGLAPLDIPWTSLNARFGEGPLGIVATVALSSTFGIVAGSVFALGEEIGWRGRLVPQLVRAGLPQPLLLSGFIWGLWHAPMIVFGDYATSQHPWLSALMFVAMITAAGVTYGWMRLATGSLWPAVLLHASHNAFFQGVFDRFTGKSPTSPFVVGESGLFPLLGYGAVAFWLWRSGRLKRVLATFRAS